MGRDAVVKVAHVDDGVGPWGDDVLAKKNGREGGLCERDSGVANQTRSDNGEGVAKFVKERVLDVAVFLANGEGFFLDLEPGHHYGEAESEEDEVGVLAEAVAEAVVEEGIDRDTGEHAVGARDDGCG